MSEILSVLFAGVFISSLYALIAIGFTLIFGVGGILNFAHGGFITLGAFAAFTISGSVGFGLPIVFGLIIATIVGGLVGGITYQVVIRPIRDRPITILILTFIIGFFIMFMLKVYAEAILETNPNEILVPQILSDQTTIAGAPIFYNDLFIFLSSWLLIGAVFWFVYYTKTGQAILAVSMSPKGAAIHGIDVERINLITWVLAGALASYAGVLFAGNIGTGGWLMSIQPPAPLILAFAIVILGGIGSIKGSVVGAYIIGFIETITVSIGYAQLAGVSSLAILLIFLLIKPEGLFGREVTE